MYGGYGGGYGGAHPMDVATVETQKADAMGVLSTQFGVQETMLKHQHESQIKMLEAEKIRAIAQMTSQYDQQRMQQKLADQDARSGEDPRDRPDDVSVRSAAHAAEARDGEDPARNGHPAAGRADDGPGQAVRDAGGDA